MAVPTPRVGAEAQGSRPPFSPVSGAETAKQKLLLDSPGDSWENWESELEEGTGVPREPLRGASAPG